MSINFTSDPLSDEQIADFALQLRRFQKISNLEVPNMNALLAKREIWTRFGIKRLEYLVVPDAELGGDEADTLVSPLAVRIRFAETTHQRLRDLDRRSRFTAAHELGHAVLHKNSAPLARSSQPNARRVVPHFVSVETQANTFASTYLITDAMAERVSSPDELSKNYLVSSAASDVRWEREAKRRDRPKIGAGLRALAAELRNGNSSKYTFLSLNTADGFFVCPRCSTRSSIEIDGRFFCQACRGDPERFPDGDGPSL
jgi:IrrE N-terminal-like domain